MSLSEGGNIPIQRNNQIKALKTVCSIQLKHLIDNTASNLMSHNTKSKIIFLTMIVKSALTKQKDFPIVDYFIE